MEENFRKSEKDKEIDQIKEKTRMMIIFLVTNIDRISTLQDK